MNQMKFFQVIIVLLIINSNLNADWVNGMMRQFVFTNTTDVNGTDFPFGDGSSPTWATLATFTIDNSAGTDDSGFIMFEAGVLFDGITEIEGVFALSLDDTIVGLNGSSSTDHWGIGKFRMHALEGVTPPSTGWSQSFTKIWPLATSLLTPASHTLKLLASWVFSDSFHRFFLLINGGS